MHRQRSLKRIAKNFRYKNSQWIILNRKHAELMVRDTKYLPIVTTYQSDQELYPATFLASQNLLNEILPQDTCYVNWERRNPPGADHPNPFVFKDFSDEYTFNCIVNAIKQKYLFARKFTASADLTLLDQFLSYRIS